jgi:hypothetical protein
MSSHITCFCTSVTLMDGSNCTCDGYWFIMVSTNIIVKHFSVGIVLNTAQYPHVVKLGNWVNWILCCPHSIYIQRRNDAQITNKSHNLQISDTPLVN